MFSWVRFIVVRCVIVLGSDRGSAWSEYDSYSFVLVAVVTVIGVFQVLVVVGHGGWVGCEGVRVVWSARSFSHSEVDVVVRTCKIK